MSQALSQAVDPAILATDPLRFISVCWPAMKLYDKQRDVLLSIRDNIETLVHAANELGKTRIAAVAVVWWFASRTPAAGDHLLVE